MKSNLPSLADLTQDVELAYKNDQLNLLLNQQPPAVWVKTHPYIKGYQYLPIDKVEHLLRKIFKRYRIEITGQGQAFNGVWVTVRVHFMNPVTGEWDYNDGIGAAQLQTKKDTSPADLLNINNGALSMAFPIAKTVAVKDACDHFGTLFGANLNRKDVVEFQVDKNLSVEDQDWQDISELYELKKDTIAPDEQVNIERIINNKEIANFKKLSKLLKSK